MPHIALVCWALLGSIPTSMGTSDAEAYRAAAARAGRDSQAHLKLALWCESHDLKAERAKHLALAVLIDPQNVAARSLLGLIAHDGRWETPEGVVKRIDANEELSGKLAEYNRRRGRVLKQTSQSASRAKLASAHLELGVWCNQAGLKAEAAAHFTSAVTLDPSRTNAWRLLGYVRHKGRWMSGEQIAAEQREAVAQREADEHWKPLLERWRGWLADEQKRPEAETLLATVSDPRAVKMIARVFRSATGADLDLVVRTLGQIDGPAASRQLAALAILPSSESTRSAAVETLRRREPREYAAMLVEMIETPIRYQFQPVLGPGQPGALAVESKGQRLVGFYDAPDIAQPGPNFFGYVGMGPNGLPVAWRGWEILEMRNSTQADGYVRLGEDRASMLFAIAEDKALNSQLQLMSDIAAVERQNARISEWNERIGQVLTKTISAPGFVLRNDRNAWQTWWWDKLGYKYEPAPEQEPETIAFMRTVQQAPPAVYSCFAPGTPVRTLGGHRSIEDLQVGDRVLSQDTSTGALSFEPIQVVHHNKPDGTLRVELDNGETLLASIYHRFWRIGKGWAMARELNSGDVLRALGGPARVVSVTPGPVTRLYNLDVAGCRTFFVGRHDALVHDNTLPDPRIKPFDAAPVLSAANR